MTDAATVLLTEQQERALSTREVSVALSAGAGCGKTFVLTRRFLQELQPGTHPDVLQKMVVITFTERAAREMRDRIRTACQANLRDAAAVADIEHWQRILRGLDSARISTIHAFCASVLRSQAVEARVDPGFEILEETTGGTFRQRIFIDVLNQLIAEQNEDAMHLVLIFGLERTRELVRAAVGRLHQLEPEQFAEHTPETLGEQWTEHWFREVLPRKFADLQAAPETVALIDLLEQHTPTHQKMQERRVVLLAELPRLTKVEPGSSAGEELLSTLITHAKVQGGGTKKHWPTEEIYTAVKDSFTWLRKQLNDLQEGLSPAPADLEQAATISLELLRVAKQIHEVYERKKRDLGFLDFDDLLIRTRDLLMHSEIVRERVASGISFLMVDEFQDTDPTQVEIVRALCGTDLFQGKLFLVGDVKQSIYRFRGADPSVFQQLRSEFPEQGQLPLSENFRSQPAVLEFVNDLFLPALGDQYESLRPRLNEQLSPLPAVEFLFATHPGNTEADSEDHTTDHTARPSARELREWEADWLARRIQSWLEDDTPRIRETDPETGTPILRRVQSGDIVILFRTLSNVAIYEEALRARNLEYYLVGGRAFYAQQEIFDLANLCQTIDDVEEEIALAGVLRSPFFSLTDDSIYSLVLAGPGLHAGLQGEPPASLEPDQQRQVRYARDVLAELRAKKDRLSLVELLNLALDRTGYDAAIVTEFMGPRKLANLKKLIEMARQFDASGLFTLKDFVQRLRDSVLEQTDEELAATHPETSNVIRLMTIHQSKGLEFPIVVLADCGWKKQGGGSGVVMHPELGPLVSLPERYGEKPRNLGLDCYRVSEDREEEAETLRLLYVATTRAADYLVLSAGMTADRKADSPWLKLLASRYDLSNGEPARDVENPETVPGVLVHQQPPATGEPSRSAKSRPVPYAEIPEQIANADPLLTPESLPDYLHSLPSSPPTRTRFSLDELLAVNQSMQPTEELTAQQRLQQLVVRCLRATDITKLQSGDSADWSQEITRVCRKLLGDEFDPETPLLRILTQFFDSEPGRMLQTAKTIRAPLDFTLQFPERTPPAILSGKLDLFVQTVGGLWQLWLWPDVNSDAVTLREIIAATVLQSLCPESDVLLYRIDPLQQFRMTERPVADRSQILNLIEQCANE